MVDERPGDDDPIELRGFAALADKLFPGAGSEQGLQRVVHFDLRHGQAVRPKNPKIYR
jgi:hypothetical protein